MLKISVENPEFALEKPAASANAIHEKKPKHMTRTYGMMT